MTARQPQPWPGSQPQGDPQLRHRLRRAGWLLFPGAVLAYRFFRPWYLHGPEDPVVARVNRARALTGMLVAATVWLVHSEATASDVINEAFAQYVFGAAVGMPFVLAAMVVLVVLATANRRRTAYRMLIGPGPRIVTVLAVVVFGVVGWLPPFNPGSSSAVGVPVPIAPYVNLQVALFLVTATVLVWLHAYGAIDGHPLLRPMITPAFAWCGAGINLFGDADGVPLWIRLLVTVGGAAIITALAVWEFRRVRQSMNLSLRAGPPPLARSGPLLTALHRWL